jgi:CRP-like cAMP-binding protein
LFAGLNDQERSVLNASFVQGQVANGAVLFKAGDHADALYLVGQGFVRMMTEAGQVLATLGPGSILGDAALFRSAPYEVTAVAVSDMECWRLTDRRLREVLLQNPILGLKLSQNFGAQLAQMEDYLLQRLSKTDELGSLPQNTLQAVAAQLRPRAIHSNQAVYRVGDTPAGLYIIEAGTVELRSEGTSAEESVQQAAPGGVLGALALLTNKPYTQSALAVQDSLLWVLSTESFHAINSRHPGLRRSLARKVRSRLGRSDQAQAVMRLSQMPLFTELPQNVMQSLAQRIVMQHIPAGDRVYRIGEAGDAFYLVEQGEIELTAENAMGVIEEKARIGANGFFGEMSMLTGQIRTEDATATRNTNLWVLYKTDLDAVAAQNPALGKALSQALASRLALSDNTSVDESRFRNFQLLAGLSSTELQQVAEYLRPTRYRYGELIFRVNTPGDKLYLIEKGQVRIQPISGGSWLLGEGEEFGERSLLTNQPHNASATAETDVDLLTLDKNDFSLLMVRYPGLAINMSRILSQRLSVGAQAAPEPVQYGLPPAGQPVAPVPVNARRRQAAMQPEQPPRRRGFGDWFGNLSALNKVLFALLVLLVVYILGIAVPLTLWSIFSPGAVADSATVSTQRAFSAVARLGSYDVAAQDDDLAHQLALADQQAPPTPTYTPFPTNTPAAQPGVLATPQPMAQKNAVEFTTELIQVAPVEPAPGIGGIAPPPQPAPPPEPAPEVQAAVAAPRNVDPRIPALGVTIEDAQVAPGQQYWRLVEVRWADEQESGGKHHIYADALDENGVRIVGQPITVWWGDGSYTNGVEDKPAPDYGFNFQMYAAGYAYQVKAEGLPSDILHGAGMGSIEQRFHGIHTSFYLLFQRATK